MSHTEDLKNVIEGLERDAERLRHDLVHLRDHMGCDGSSLDQLCGAWDALKAEAARTRPLEAEIRRAHARIVTLQTENEQLRTALEPFAKAGRQIQPHNTSIRMCIDGSQNPMLNDWNIWLAAAKALEK